MSRLIDTIDSPEDLRRLGREELPVLAKEIREEIKKGGSLNRVLKVKKWEKNIG